VSEILCTYIHPKDLMPSAYGKNNGNKEEEIMNFAKSIYSQSEEKIMKLFESVYGQGGEFIMNFIKSIKKDGIKFPIVCECNNKKYKAPTIGYKRLLIALALGFKKIPVVLWSQHNKTGHQGKLINEQSDILDILGKEIENNLTHEHIVGAYRKLPYPKNTI
jgi:hypothetical protein|tara:strand:+ start:737 stop:1222 length:486 start_codon:yes stop_codon:yes gene_type:complete